jgi:hypothetical protein
VPEPNWAGVLTRQYTNAADWARKAGVETPGVEFDNIVATSIMPLDFRRDHWELARYPLVVCKDPPQPAQAKILQLCEFFQKFREEVLRRGAFLIANIRIDPFIMSQYIDFMAHEGYNREVVERLRLLAGPKPASYIPVGERLTREAFNNCLSYGVGPGLGQTSDELRALHREFMPLIVTLSRAGWQPIPYARHSADGAVVERFGEFEAGNLSFTVRHPSEDVPDGVLRVDMRGAGIPERDVMVIDMRRNEEVEAKWEPPRLIVPLPTQAGRTEVIRVCRPAAWRREMLLRVCKALKRAGGEWHWIKAQHSGALTSHLDFEEDKGRWFRYGFEEAKAGLSPEAHSGESALLIEADSPADGTIKTEPVLIRVGMPHRVAFYYRAEGTGEVKPKVVLYPSWYTGRAALGDVPLADLSLPADEGWQRVESEVEPGGNTRKIYLQLDFRSFVGRFWLDTYSLAPCFDPLPEVPEFGFTELCGQLRSAVRQGQDAEAVALLDEIQARLPAWRADAERLPSDYAHRVGVEIGIVQESLELCRRQLN